VPSLSLSVFLSCNTMEPPARRLVTDCHGWNYHEHVYASSTQFHRPCLTLLPVRLSKTQQPSPYWNSFLLSRWIESVHKPWRIGSCILASTVRARSIMPSSIMQALTKLLSVDWNKAYNERPRWNSSKLCALQTPARSQGSPDTEHYISFLEQGTNKTSPVLRTGHPALSLCCNPCGRSTGKLEATKSNSISLTSPLEGGRDYEQWKNSTKIGEP
jgi:hypothetical protein